MKNKKNKVWNWVLEHVRPQVEWYKKPDGVKPEKLDIEDNVKEHVILGIKFKWKF